ncbi:hypothetical protein Tco_0158145 [Tanacetum coccineum]
MILKICSYSIFRKLNRSPKTDKTSLHNGNQHVDRNLVIRNRVGDLQLGLKLSKKINLERLQIGMQQTINSKRLYDLMDVDKVMEKLDHMVKTFLCSSYNKGMETKKWSEMTREEAKTSSLQARKDYMISRICRRLVSFVGGRIRDIDYRLINRNNLTT